MQMPGSVQLQNFLQLGIDPLFWVQCIPADHPHTCTDMQNTHTQSKTHTNHVRLSRNTQIIKTG